ncbi:nuclease domain-containing protein [Guptibacillus hwajinpoensis]|uniref:nuclease domain-containing protein n=1 Tax=Guptibacillus hwajinpoensis TaxID=208199 RepID=UPI003CFBF783
MVTRYKDKKLPFSCYFEDRFERKYEVKELWKSEGDMEVSNFPILKENSIIGLQFYVEEEVMYDPQSYCSVQTNLYDESDEQVVLKHSLKLGDADKEWVYQGGNDEEFPWRMGVYFLEVYYKGERYLGGINVLPHHLNERQVKEIHDYLNEQVQDIIYDFVYSNKTFSKNDETVLPKYWYYDYARKIAEVYEEFMYCMTAIEKNPKERMESMYKPSVRSGKIDQKSIRWSLSNKGLEKNAGIHQNNFQLNKKKMTNYDSKENRWIKNILLIWKRDILNVASYIKRDLNNYSNKLKKQKEEYDRIYQEKEFLMSKRDPGEYTKRNVKSQMLMIEKDMNNTRTKVSILKGKLDILSKMESKLIYFMKNTFLENVERGMRKPFLKKNQYYRVDSIFEELKRIRENKGENNQLTPILKPTWQIYEYFCLFKVVKILRDSGYSLIEGIDEDVLNLYFEDKIQEGTKFVLESENKVVHIWYDHYHAHTEQEALDKGELFYTPNPKKKPDLKIDFFTKTHNGQLFDTSVVMDAKFSQLKTIYNHQYRNRTTEQLLGYYSYFCVLPEAGHRPCVDRVVCLYAGEGIRDVQKRYENIIYLRLHPLLDDTGTYVVGEEELRNILQLSS